MNRTNRKTQFALAALFVGALFVRIPLAQALPADEPVGQEVPLESPGASAPSPDESANASTGATRMATAPYPRSRFPITLDIRYGLPLNTGDEEVHSPWSHNIWSSYMGVIGAYWESPRLINGDWWFFTGPEFAYQHNIEEMSSSLGSTTLTTNTMGFQINCGFSWQPSFFDRKIGAQLAVAIPIWAQKSTGLDSPGFSKDLGQQSAIPFDMALNFFYDFDHHWKPFLGYELRYSSNITLGLNYAF